MEFDPDLAAIHGYLCADGYVITNPPTQKHKYYYIGLRNTNELLLTDFQKRFKRRFGITPIIEKNERCKIQNKRIFRILTENHTYYSDKWTFPDLSANLIKFWLRAYFDCDGWVSVVKAKDRKIGLDSINGKGLIKIKEKLKEFYDIDSGVKKRNTREIWSLSICGKDDLEKFQKNIGFLHPKKSAKLQQALDSYVNYEWKIPKNQKKLIEFLFAKGRINIKRKEIRVFSIVEKNLISLNNNLNQLDIRSRVLGPWKNSNSTYYCLSISFRELNRTGVKNNDNSKLFAEA